MNYYLFQSTFFIVFIGIAAMAFAALPFMKNSFADVSDNYIKSELSRMQAEMLFVSVRQNTFTNFCTTGEVNGIVLDLIKNKTTSLHCKTNAPINNQVIVCAELKNENHYCVDYLGVECEVAHQPPRGYSCKEI
ncbi:MAG: hypothetical protein MRY57_01715 [Candidatus Pacebacteria bacterium]|nr:hypothetical protein [Candidatus Paceibacterota bacterium]